MLQRCYKSVTEVVKVLVRAGSREQRSDSRKQRAESREQRAESRGKREEGRLTGE
jgi:hypothetical protein